MSLCHMSPDYVTIDKEIPWRSPEIWKPSNQLWLEYVSPVAATIGSMCWWGTLCISLSLCCQILRYSILMTICDILHPLMCGLTFISPSSHLAVCKSDLILTSNSSGSTVSFRIECICSLFYWIRFSKKRYSVWPVQGITWFK